MIVMTQETVAFIAIAIAMTALAVFFLSRPWLRKETSGGVDRSNFTVQVYRDQLAELETDMNEQRLTEEQYNQARQDLERSMMDDIGRPGPSVPLPEPEEKNRSAGLWALILIGVSLPVLALILYGVLHISIQAMAPPAQVVSDQGAGAAATATNDPNFSIEEMVTRLATRMEQNPNDATGWTMLGRSYTVLKRYPESRDAYAKAYKLRAAATLTQEDSALLSDYAEVVSRTQDNQFDEQAMALLTQALDLDPSNQKALWLAGMGSFQAKQYPMAIIHWERLYQLVPNGSEMKSSLQGAIEEAKIRNGDLQIVPEETNDAATDSTEQTAAPASPGSGPAG